MILIHANDSSSDIGVATAVELTAREDGSFTFRQIKVFSCEDGNDFQTEVGPTTVKHSVAVDYFKAFYEWGNDGTMLDS